MNKWIEYNKHSRKQIKTARSIGVRLSNGSTKTILSKEGMQHYVNYDCSTLITHFQVIS